MSVEEVDDIDRIIARPRETAKVYPGYDDVYGILFEILKEIFSEDYYYFSMDEDGKLSVFNHNKTDGKNS